MRIKGEEGQECQIENLGVFRSKKGAQFSFDVCSVYDLTILSSFCMFTVADKYWIVN